MRVLSPKLLTISCRDAFQATNTVSVVQNFDRELSYVVDSFLVPLALKKLTTIRTRGWLAPSGNRTARSTTDPGTGWTFCSTRGLPGSCKGD